MVQGLTARIEERLRDLKLTPRAASLMVGDNPDFIRGILRQGESANPTASSVDKLVQALQTSREWLLGETNAEEQQQVMERLGRRPDVQRTDLKFPYPDTAPRDVPVLGTAAGAVVMEMEGFQFSGSEPIAFAQRPPALAGVKDIYAIFITGDSMYPMHPPGDVRFVNPHRPPAPGDTVVLQTKRWEADPGQGYIKIYRRKKLDKLMLEQLNPPSMVEVPLKYVASIHRVYPINELFGL